MKTMNPAFQLSRHSSFLKFQLPRVHHGANDQTKHVHMQKDNMVVVVEVEVVVFISTERQNVVSRGDAEEFLDPVHTNLFP